MSQEPKWKTLARKIDPLRQAFGDLAGDGTARIDAWREHLRNIFLNTPDPVSEEEAQLKANPPALRSAFPGKSPNDDEKKKFEAFSADLGRLNPEAYTRAVRKARRLHKDVENGSWQGRKITPGEFRFIAKEVRELVSGHMQATDGSGGISFHDPQMASFALAVAAMAQDHLERAEKAQVMDMTDKALRSYLHESPAANAVLHALVREENGAALTLADLQEETERNLSAPDMRQIVSDLCEIYRGTGIAPPLHVTLSIVTPDMSLYVLPDSRVDDVRRLLALGLPRREAGASPFLNPSN